MKATEVTAGLAESNGSLLPVYGVIYFVICGLTACTPGSTPGPTLGNEYRKTLLYFLLYSFILFSIVMPGYVLTGVTGTKSPVL